jgi:NAD(P)-dependent dehydrogenase (short-subunit alcohol dehydrogenase family)
VLIHNAVGGGWGTFLEIEPKMLDRNFQVNVMGLLYLAREVAPDMIKAGNGTILVTGNTSAIRGKANFSGFAPTKAAQRILSESIARDLARYPRRLRPDRCRDRCSADARAPARSIRRILYQAIRDRRRTVAPLQAGPLGLVLPYRASPVRGKMVKRMPESRLCAT